MQPSQRELEQLFDDADLAAEARFLSVATSWPSLRVLDYLHAAGPATTGEVARELNMDMSEVRDRLEALEDVDLAERDDEAWLPAAAGVGVQLAGTDGGLRADHTVTDEADGIRDPALDPERAGEADRRGGVEGPFERLGRTLDALVPPW